MNEPDLLESGKRSPILPYFQPCGLLVCRAWAGIAGAIHPSASDTIRSLWMLSAPDPTFLLEAVGKLGKHRDCAAPTILPAQSQTRGIAPYVWFGAEGVAVMILGCSELLGLPGVNPVGCLSEKVTLMVCGAPD